MNGPFALWRASLLPDYDHFTRAAWRKQFRDPVYVSVIMRILTIYTLVAFVPFLPTSVCVIWRMCPDWLTFEWRVGILFNFMIAFGTTFCAFVGWGVNADDYFVYLDKALKHLRVTPYWILSSSHHSAISSATFRLMELGDVVIEANKTYDDPRHEKRVEAFDQFEEAYDIFLRIGIIRNDGYGKYLARPVQIKLTHHGSMIMAAIGKSSGVGKNPDEAIGNFVRTHPEKIDAIIDWSELQEVTW